MSAAMMTCVICRELEHVDHMGQKTTKRREANYPVCRRCRMPKRLWPEWDALQAAERSAWHGDSVAIMRLRRLRQDFEIAKRPKVKA